MSLKGKNMERKQSYMEWKNQLDEEEHFFEKKQL